jgi:hypothetical protein
VGPACTRAGRETASNAPDVSSAVTPAGWLARAQEHIAEREYRASATEGGLQAPNRAHGLRTWFEPTGIRVHARTAAGSPALVALRLAGVGRADSLAAVAAGQVTSAESRVEIRRPNLVEWYVNAPAGLEQGFTLDERPRGEGALVFELAVSQARASLRGDVVVLATEAGRRLRYGALAARDASGRELAARFEVAAADRIRLVVDDAGAAYPVVVDPLLTETADAQLESNQASAQLGVGVAGAGDVNGDGYADLIVGADQYDAGQAWEGAAFVFLGSAAGIADGSPATAAAQLESDQASAFLGYSVAGAGDVNGDGYADVIVGAHNYYAGQNGEGAAFVFLGSAAGIADGNPTTAAARFESDQEFAALGLSVAGAGDVNGDGYADLIVGSPYYDAGQARGEGAAFVFHGRAFCPPPCVGNPLLADAQLESDQANAHFGRGVAGAGDVNADGYADVIVGAASYDAGQTDEGAAFVFLGSAAGIADGSPATAAAQLESDQASANLGLSVAGAGDVNGDGYADVIVGAYHYSAGQSWEGAAFVFPGSAAGIADGNPTTAAAQLESDQAGADMGWSAAGAGDVNGDGYADVIVGAYFYDAGQADEGAAFVFLGSAAGIADGRPTTAAAQLEPDQIGAQMGYSVGGAGDVDGDGYADVIVGANSYDAGQADEGAAFVFLGGAAGIADGSPATAATTLDTDQEIAALGDSVASAGDVNGDGYADVIVGAPNYDAGQLDEGAAFVFLGSAGGIADGSTATAAAELESNQVQAYFGYSVAGAGDVNGDGYADVIVGARWYDAPELTEGAAFVFLGGAAGIGDGSPATAASQLESDQLGAELGRSVAGAGDVNGDGYADVIVGAPWYDAGQTNEGAAFVFLGSAAGIADGDPATAAAQIESEQGGGWLGASVAGAGDVNGDGHADVIVGAPYYDAGEAEEGGAFVFLGSAAGIADGSPATAAAQLESNSHEGYLGWSVASAGDVNGDGYADVIVGAPTYDSGQADEGAAFIFLGSAAGIADGDPATAAARIESEQAGAWLGTSVAGAGDVNGDGHADVIVGAPYYEAGEDHEGGAFVFLGSASGIADGSPATAAGQLESNWPDAYLGSTVAAAGDVNGDGYADVIVGVPHYDERGAALVFLGNGNAGGRPVLARQRRGDGSGVAVAPWGRAWDADGFGVELRASHPQGRGLVRAEIEACPRGVAFGDASCTTALSPYGGVSGGSPEAVLAHTFTGLPTNRLHRWRARVLHFPATLPLPAKPPHGPWRRLGAQGVEADVRTTWTDCTDAVDDDQDGLLDYPVDAGCTSEADTSERQAGRICDDGLDNDADGWTDYSTVASLADPGCRNANAARENPQCQDGVNNDGATGIDFDGGASLHGGVPIDVKDPQCATLWDNKEASSTCGIGFELALVLPALEALRRRARRAR